MDQRGFPTTLPEFQRVFPTDQSCATYLEKLRWPDQFVCTKCKQMGEPYRFAARPQVLRCRACRADTSLTRGTVMDHTHTPLSVWFWAAYLQTTQTPGESATQFQRQLGLTRYETAYQIMHKLRAGMVRPQRDEIGGEHTVELDETLVGGKTKGEGAGVHHKVYVLGAVECRQRKAGETIANGAELREPSPKRRRATYAGRVRLLVASDRQAPTCEDFARSNLVRGTTVKTDGWQGYNALRSMGYAHAPVVLRGDSDLADAHLPLIHLVFSLLKTWLAGTHHGVSVKHMQAYMNEYTFRFNRRFYPMTSFNSLLGIGAKTIPPTYAQLYSGEWHHPAGAPESPQLEMPFA